MIIAIGSAENVIGKMREHFQNMDYSPGITKGFEKGRAAPGTEHLNVFTTPLSKYDPGRERIYTRETVAREAVDWLADKLRDRHHMTTRRLHTDHAQRKSVWKLW